MLKKSLYPLLIIIAASSYGILSTIIKVAMNDGYASSETITSQYFAGFFLATLLFLLTRQSFPRISKKGLLILMATGMLTATTGTVYGQALNYLSASLAVVIFFQFTWIGMLIHCIVHKRFPKRAEWVSLLFLLSGTVLAAGVLDVDLSTVPWQGWAWGFAAAISFSLFIQVNSIPIEGLSTVSRLFIVSIFSVIMISIYLEPEIIWDGRLFGTDLWIYGLVLGFFGIVLPILLFSIAVPKVGGGMASIFSAMELPVAIIVSVMVLDETITSIQVLGILLVLFGMIFPALVKRKSSTST